MLVCCNNNETQKRAAGHTVPAVAVAIARWYVPNWFDEITNSFDYPYTNGTLDGFHTKIKTLKNSFRLRNFEIFRKRIFAIS